MPPSDATDALDATERLTAIYQQRYETYRHLDRLRWQIPTFAISGGGVALSVATAAGTTLPPSWALVLFGVLVALSALATDQITRGIHANGEVLRRVGRERGNL